MFNSSTIQKFFFLSLVHPSLCSLVFKMVCVCVCACVCVRISVCMPLKEKIKVKHLCPTIRDNIVTLHHFIHLHFQHNKHDVR